MKPSWGIGVVVAILLSVALGLLGVVHLRGTVSLILLLTGAWTFLSAFVIVDKEDRTFYAGWGVVIAGLSLTYVISLADALALILIAIVLLIIVTVYFGKSPKDFTAATHPQPAAGETPAATAI
jgi:hypothetical protein